MSSLNLSLSYGYLYNGNKLRERPNTTLTTVFNRDLASITHPIRLHLCKDLAEITDLAPRQETPGVGRGVHRIPSQVEKAAEVLQTKN